jgi:hypothetical protein
MGLFDDIVPPAEKPRKGGLFDDIVPPAGMTQADAAALPDADPDRPPLVVNVRPLPRGSVNPDATGAGGSTSADATVDPVAVGGAKVSPGAVDAIGRGSLQGFTFNWADELAALQAAGGSPDGIFGTGIPSPLAMAAGGVRLAGEKLGVGDGEGGKAYDSSLEQSRAANEAAKAAHPGSYFVGELGGAVAQTPFTPMLAPFRAAKATAEAARAAGLVPTLSPVRQAGNLVATGAGYGAAAGFGGATGGAGDQVGGTLTGAATGAVLTPLLSGAISAGGRVAGFVRDHLRASRDPQRVADQLVKRAFQRDAADPAMLRDEIATDQAARAGERQNLTAADIAGTNTQSLAGTVARQPGPGRDTAERFLKTRQVGNGTTPSQGDRVTEQLGVLLGDGRTLATADRILKRRRKEADPAYTAAFAKKLDYDDPRAHELLELLEVLPAKVKGRANELIQLKRAEGTQQEYLPLTPEELAKRAAEARRTRAPDYTPPAPPKPVPQSDAPREKPLKRTAPASTKAMSLKNFIAHNGGLELNPDAVAADFHVQNIPGAGMLARKGGKSIDSYWREKLVEEGYLPREALGEDARKFIFDALDAEIRHGQKTYPINKQADKDLENAVKAGRNENVEIQAAKREILKELKAAGVIKNNFEADHAALADAAESWMRGHASDPLDAYERAVLDASKNAPDRPVPPPEAYDAAAADGPQSLEDIFEAIGMSPGGEPMFTLKSVPNVRQWDYIRRALRDELAGETDKLTGRVTDRGGAISSLIRHIDNRLSKMVPELAEARRIYKGESELLEAVESGAEVWAPKFTREQLERKLAKMGEDEVEMYRLGAVNALKEQLDGKGFGHDKLRAVWGSPVMRDKLRLLAPDRKTFAEFERLMANEEKMVETRVSAVGNSLTAKRLADDADAANPEMLVEAVNAAAETLTGNAKALVVRALRYTSKINPDYRGKVLEEVRKVILNPDPAAIDAFAARLAKVPGLPARASSEMVSLLRQALPRAVTTASTEQKRKPDITVRPSR